MAKYLKVNSDASTSDASTAASIGGLITVIGDILKTGYNKICGYTKIDNRPSGGATNAYALQVRTESANTTGQQWGIDCEAHLKATGTASVRGTQGVAVVDAAYTATTSTLIGTYGQARVDGTIAGASFMAGLYGLIGPSTAITATHVTSCWLDSHQAESVTGAHDLLYMTNNGAAQMDQAIHVYGGDKITALLNLDTVSGMVAATATTSGSSKKIKIVIDGVVHYLNAYTG
jgi:hypothetical protein